MIIKWKYLVTAVIIMDIIYIALFYYINLMYYPQNINKKITRYDLNENTQKVVLSGKSLSLEYGDIIQNHELYDMFNNKVIISNSNMMFKFLKFVPLLNSDNIDINDIISFIELVHKFENSEIQINQSKIQFFYVVIIDSLNLNRSKLANFQKKLNINIITISKDELFKYYKISENYNGFSVLLDKFNKIRFAYNTQENELVLRIIRQELLKDTL